VTYTPATARALRDRRRLLAYLATEFGVRVIEHDAAEAWRTLLNERPASWSEAPFTSHLGCIWDRFEIIATTETPWPHLLHEAGHLVATTERPAAAKEFTFLGWEIGVVEHLGLSMKAFHASNAEYGVTFGQYYEMGALKLGSKDWWKFVGEAQATSRDAKLFHKYGTVPTALRSNVLR
jgi:hypothetical protein